MTMLLAALNDADGVFTSSLKPALKSVMAEGVPFSLALAVYGFEEPDFDELMLKIKQKKRGLASGRQYVKLNRAANEAMWAADKSYWADNLRSMVSGKLLDSFSDRRYKTNRLRDPFEHKFNTKLIEPNIVMGLAFMKDYASLNEYYEEWCQRHTVDVPAGDEALVNQYLIALVELACFIMDYDGV